MLVVAKKLFRFAATLLLVIGVASQVSAQDQANPLEARTLSRLGTLGLSDSQVSKIRGIAESYYPRIQEAEEQSAQTKAQRAQRAAAIKKAIAEGKKGKAFNQAVAGAGALTDKQRQARRQAANLSGEFDRAVMNVLTGEQREQLGEQKGAQFSGYIVVRISSEHPPATDDANTLSDAADQLNLRGLQGALKELELTVTGRLVKSISVQKIRELEQKQVDAAFAPRHSLASYWRIDARNLGDGADAAVKRLNDLPEVDLAYREMTVTDPVVNPSDDPYNSQQEYQDPAPQGINARWAWTQPNSEGAGVGFVDLEQGWFPGHEDYTSKSPVIIYGDNRDGELGYKGNHGTAVLGEAIADDNTLGVVGIAPSVDYVSMTSHYDDATGTNGHVADAIMGALPAMNPGDVLLLEVQRNYLPTETDDADYDAIRLAVAAGIIVVEAAGNGDNDLDAYTNAAGKKIFDRSSPDFRDSGAIMCGACESALPHDRWTYSNYGSRIDCFAYGENVVTCGYGDLAGMGMDNQSYTAEFQGTSSASPMVAGAAIILQGMYKAGSGTVMSPTQMRTLLANPATGTAQGPGTAGFIGVMPDLQKIIEESLDIPDLYVRDNVGDTGEVPQTGPISASPDIIVRPVAVPDPQAAFGEGSGTENDATLGYEVEAGQDNYVYVRMANRGNDAANGAKTRVYWSPVSTLVTPDMWTLVGTAGPINVPATDELVVSDAIVWEEAKLPGPGHYCFVGFVDHPRDAAPPIPPATDWDGFRDLIRNQNNVTWRNFNVVDVVPGGDPSAMAFLIAGAPDQARLFDLEIMRRFERRGAVALEVPLRLGRQLVRGRPDLKSEENQRTKTMRIQLPDEKRVAFKRVKLGKGAKHKAKFVAAFGEINRPGDRLAIRQMFEREEVGRVTWLFAKRKPLE